MTMDTPTKAKQAGGKKRREHLPIDREPEPPAKVPVTSAEQRTKPLFDDVVPAPTAPPQEDVATGEVQSKETGWADVSDIRRSPFNYRRTFVGIEELAASIKQDGQLSPLICRRIPGEAEALELVCGERRLRALLLSGTKVAWVDIRELSDERVAALQLVENVHQAKVDPLEEADGFAALHRFGWSHERIGIEIHKGAKYVAERLLLAKLGPQGRAALDAGRLTLYGATKIARLPTADLQKAAVETIAPGSRDGSPMGAKDVLRVIEGRFTLRLADAPFDRTDSGLVTIATTCGACPKRTGAQAALLDELEGEDVCTDPMCFGAKRDATWNQRAAAIEAAGGTVLSLDETRKIMPNGALAWNAPYLRLDATASGSVAGQPAATWRDLLLGRGAPVVVALDSTGQAHELVGKREALKTLGQRPSDSQTIKEARGQLADEVRELVAREAAQADPDAARRAEEQTAQQQAEARAKREAEAAERGLAQAKKMAALVAHAESGPIGVELLRLVVLGLAGVDVPEGLLERRCLDGDSGNSGHDVLLGKVRTMGEGELRGVLVELGLSFASDGDEPDSVFEAACALAKRARKAAKAPPAKASTPGKAKAKKAVARGVHAGRASAARRRLAAWALVALV